MGSILTSLLMPRDTSDDIMNHVNDLERYDRDTYARKRQLKQRLLYTRTLTESECETDEDIRLDILK